MRHIRPFQLFRLLGDDNHAHLTIPTVPGTESLTIFSLETLLLIAIARITRARSILEIGTSLGYTSLHLAMNTAADISTIDIERKPTAFDNTIWDGRITRITQDVAQVASMPMDMVFCDCNYTLELCRKGSELAFACRPKVIAWHDFGNPESPGQITHMGELSKSHEIIHIEDTWLCLWFADGRELGVSGVPTRISMSDAPRQT